MTQSLIFIDKSSFKFKKKKVNKKIKFSLKCCSNFSSVNYLLLRVTAWECIHRNLCLLFYLLIFFLLCLFLFSCYLENQTVPSSTISWSLRCNPLIAPIFVPMLQNMPLDCIPANAILNEPNDCLTWVDQLSIIYQKLVMIAKTMMKNVHWPTIEV